MSAKISVDTAENEVAGSFVLLSSVVLHGELPATFIFEDSCGLTDR